ncbi:MAG: hypothetical protein WCK67_05920 [bacterium]
MKRKNWNACYICKHIKLCISGKNRIINISADNTILNDIGCFDFEQYKKQIEPRQLGLF